MINTLNQEKVWRNALIASFDEEKSSHPYGLLKGYSLITRGSYIYKILPDFDLPNSYKKRAINAEGRLITPGLIDCHNHLIFSGSRAIEWEKRLKGLSYQQISAQGGGINSTVKATRKSSLQELKKKSEKRIEHLIQQGVTTLEIKSGYGLDEKNEKKILHVAGMLKKEYPIAVSRTFLAAHTTPEEYKDHPDKYISLICSVILPCLWKEGLFEAVDVFCENVGFNLSQTREVLKTAHSLHIPVKGHVEQFSSLGGAKLVSQFNGLSVDHLEYLDKDSIDVMAKNHTVAVLLPGSYYFLQQKRLPPIAYLRKKGISIAIATDYNPGTSPFINIHNIMNMACVVFGMTPEEAWNGVTKYAAQALGHDCNRGRLKAGFFADFVVWDVENPVEIIYEPGINYLHQRIFRGEENWR